MSNGQFKVHRRDILSTRMMCDNGYTDCPNGSDERNCLKLVLMILPVVIVVGIVAA